MQRHEFLRTSACVSLGILLSHVAPLGMAQGPSVRRPNLLVVTTERLADNVIPIPLADSPVPAKRKKGK